MFCTKCGNQFEQTDVFCAKCGNKKAKTQQSQNESLNTPPRLEPSPIDTSTDIASISKPMSQGMKWFLWALAISLVLVIFVAVGNKDQALKSDNELRQQCYETINILQGPIALEQVHSGSIENTGVSFKIQGVALGGEFRCVLNTNGVVTQAIWYPTGGEPVSFTG